jgi:hypothetical protein
MGLFRFTRNLEREESNCGKLSLVLGCCLVLELVSLVLALLSLCLLGYFPIHFSSRRILSFFAKFCNFAIFQFFHSKFPDVFCKNCHFRRFFDFCSILVSFWISCGF